MRREHLFAAFFFAVFLFLIYQLYQFLLPSAAPLFLAGVLAVTLSPVTARVVARLGGSRTLGALVMTVGTVLLVLVPLLILLSMLVSEAIDFYQRAEQVEQQVQEGRQAVSDWLHDLRERLERGRRVGRARISFHRLFWRRS